MLMLHDAHALFVRRAQRLAVQAACSLAGTLAHEGGRLGVCGCFCDGAARVHAGGLRECHCGEVAFAAPAHPRTITRRHRLARLSLSICPASWRSRTRPRGWSVHAYDTPRRRWTPERPRLSMEPARRWLQCVQWAVPVCAGTADECEHRKTAPRCVAPQCMITAGACT